jgi:hypothetical protein
MGTAVVLLAISTTTTYCGCHTNKHTQTKWGTSFAFSASVGGLLELRSEWASWLTNKAEVHPFSATTLAGQVS